jgi:hypothetical protein
VRNVVTINGVNVIHVSLAGLYAVCFIAYVMVSLGIGLMKIVYHVVVVD